MDPLLEYTARREHWLTERQTLDSLYIRVGNYRLVLVLAAILLAWLSFWRGALSGRWLLLPLALFIGLVVWHARIARRQTLAQRGLAYYDRGLARLDDRWAGSGNSGEGFWDPQHVYADDLDVFGRGSLFELIDAARTATGEKTLANWFLAPASRGTVLARQEAARELRERLDLREDIALLGEDVRAEVHADALDRWGSAPAIHFAAALRPVALSSGGGGNRHVGRIPGRHDPPFTFLSCAGRKCRLHCAGEAARQARHQGVETPGSDFRVLSLTLERLEAEQFTSPLLRELRATLDVQHRPASSRHCPPGALGGVAGLERPRVGARFGAGGAVARANCDGN